MTKTRGIDRGRISHQVSSRHNPQNSRHISDRAFRNAVDRINHPISTRGSIRTRAPSRSDTRRRQTRQDPPPNLSVPMSIDEDDLDTSSPAAIVQGSDPFPPYYQINQSVQVTDANGDRPFRVLGGDDDSTPPNSDDEDEDRPSRQYFMLPGQVLDYFYDRDTPKRNLSPDGTVVNNRVVKRAIPHYAYVNEEGRLDLQALRALIERLQKPFNFLIPRSISNEKVYDRVERNKTEGRQLWSYAMQHRVPAGPDSFVENEFRRLVRFERKPRDAQNKVDFHPTCSPDGWLFVPISDVRDLPTAILLYILFRLSTIPRDTAVAPLLVLGGNEDDDDSSQHTQTILQQKNGRPLQLDGNNINMEQVRRLYEVLMATVGGEFADQTNRYGESWNGSLESGVRMMLFSRGASGPKTIPDIGFRFKLEFRPLHGQRIPGRWSQEIESFVTETLCTMKDGVFTPSVLSVRNHDDDKCMLYCVILGLIVCIKNARAVLSTAGPNSCFFEDSEIKCKGLFWHFPNDDDSVSERIRYLSQFLSVNQYGVAFRGGVAGFPEMSNDDEAEMVSFINDLDKKVGMMTTVVGFHDIMKQVEFMLLPEHECGIDVLGIDYNISKHVYPLYISKFREKIITLLCITPYKSQASHYCLVIDTKLLFHQSGGKQFWSCSKCGSTFYHKRLQQEHFENCNGLECYEDGGYHCSSLTDIGWPPDMSNVTYLCDKCRLQFSTRFQYEYHKEHCMMKGKTGYRHVQLIQPKKMLPNQHLEGAALEPKLRGEVIDEEAESKHVRMRRVMYADFECSINPETGEHTFMSYGLYDVKSAHFEIGYELGKFMEAILNIGSEGDESDLYVYFHNAMNYDGNFVLRYVLKHYPDWGIKTIMKSSNRLQKLTFYVTMEDVTEKKVRKKIHIGDTFLFLTLSLERLVASIRKNTLEDNRKNFPRFFATFKYRYPFISDEEIDHILKKNIFPYKFFVDSSRLDTSIEEFARIFEPREENLQYFSERVTKDDLVEQQSLTNHVFDVFRCKTAKDYHDIYLCCDVMQLADIFERSMAILHESHGIHLTKYVGMPAASWAAFLRFNPDMEIPLYSDTLYAEFFKQMVRGGITSAALRHAVADQTHSIIYLDVNGLYPYVMQAYDYPCGTFAWRVFGEGALRDFRQKYLDPNLQWKDLLKKLFARLRIQHRGICLCVDLHVPREIMEKTDGYPFAPEHRRIFDEYYDLNHDYHPFLQRWSMANNNEKMKEFTGLVCTLYDKQKYNVHWRLLEWYMDHGMEVEHVHYGIEFSEGDYLAGYIRHNIEIRNGRKDELGKTVYKLLGNSVYGKTFESPFKRNTYEIVRNEVRLQGLLEEGSLASMTPIDDLGTVVKMDGDDIILDKPTYIGACVCEYAKLHMYKLLYDEIASIFPEGVEMVYTDTDSFILRIQHAPELGYDPAKLFAYIKEKAPSLIGGIGGQVKSETGEDETIQEVIALRSKVYAYKTTGGHIGKRAKGTTHDAQEMQLDWDTYKKALECLTSINTSNITFLRKTFKVSTISALRRSLSVNDGKRFICEDGIHTHAFGYVPTFADIN